MGSVRTNPYSKLKKKTSTADLVLASLALGMLVLFVIHFVVFRSVASLVKPKAIGDAIAAKRASGPSEQMLKALIAADEGDSVNRVVRAANAPGDGGAPTGILHLQGVDGGAGS